MDLASIMVSLDLGSSAPERVRLATSVADRYEAAGVEAGPQRCAVAAQVDGQALRARGERGRSARPGHLYRVSGGAVPAPGARKRALTPRPPLPRWERGRWCGRGGLKPAPDMQSPLCGLRRSA